MVRKGLVLTALIGLVSGIPDDAHTVEKLRFEAIQPLVAKSEENLIVDIYVSSEAQYYIGNIFSKKFCWNFSHCED